MALSQQTLRQIISPRLHDDGPALVLQADALAKVPADRVSELRARWRKVAYTVEELGAAGRPSNEPVSDR